MAEELPGKKEVRSLGLVERPKIARMARTEEEREISNKAWADRRGYDFVDGQCVRRPGTTVDLEVERYVRFMNDRGLW
jgi:hypothetical protein